MIRCKIYLEDIGNTCPVCGEQKLDASMDDHIDGEYQDTHKCRNCGLAVTYITKDDDVRQYHEYRDGEIEVQLELFFGGFETHQNKMMDFLEEVIQAIQHKDDGDAYSTRRFNTLSETAAQMKQLLASDNPSSEA